MDEALRKLVRLRANGRCEYCHLPQAGHDERFSIDHIIAKKHGGDALAGNLAQSCLRCNLRKGTNLSGMDPESGQVTNLFNPRNDRWDEHFRFSGPALIGLTAIGRASVIVMDMNSRERLLLREALIAEGIQI